MTTYISLSFRTINVQSLFDDIASYNVIYLNYVFIRNIVVKLVSPIIMRRLHEQISCVTFFYDKYNS